MRSDLQYPGRLPPLKITVLAGGPSAERQVSFMSGNAIAAALRERGHQVTVADIGPDDLAALDIPADVVFPALHGTFGEDGQLQALLEQRRLPFVGSDARASALCMDKVATKSAAANLNIATPQHWVVSSVEADQTASIPLPAVVKPIAEGSSICTAIVRTQEELHAATRIVIDRYGSALVEAFIDGEEVTVAIVGDTTLPIIAIRPDRTFYDYTAKYADQQTRFIFETQLAAHTLSTLSKDSLRLFETLGCRHVARVDWIVDASGKPWFLEINTLPGFTDHSLVPKAAARHGWSFAELTERLVFMALEDHDWQDQKNPIAVAANTKSL